MLKGCMGLSGIARKRGYIPAYTPSAVWEIIAMPSTSSAADFLFFGRAHRNIKALHKRVIGYVRDLSIFAFRRTRGALVLFFRPKWGTKITDNAVCEPNVGKPGEMQRACSTVARDIDLSEVHDKAGYEDRGYPGKGESANS